MKLLLEEQKKPLSEARSEMNLQESRVESADRAGSRWIQCRRFILNAWNSTRRISHLITPGERQIGSIQNWRTEKELFSEHVSELFRKWKEFKKVFLVHKLTELHSWTKKNILNKKWKSIYSESANGSNREIKKTKWIVGAIPGISVTLRRQAALGYHTFPVTLWLFWIFVECSQLDTRDLYRTSGNVFEDLLAPNEPTAAWFGNVRSVTDTHCEFVSLSTGRVAVTQKKEREIYSKLGKCLHRDLSGSF